MCVLLTQFSVRTNTVHIQKQTMRYGGKGRKGQKSNTRKETKKKNDNKIKWNKTKETEMENNQSNKLLSMTDGREAILFLFSRPVFLSTWIPFFRLFLFATINVRFLLRMLDADCLFSPDIIQVEIVNFKLLKCKLPFLSRCFLHGLLEFVAHTLHQNPQWHMLHRTLDSATEFIDFLFSANNEKIKCRK